jgi:hypothetical protein
MATPLGQEEFDHLLEAYAFDDISDADRRRILAAVLDSDERSLAFARVQELRDQLADPQFRRELLDVLPEPRPEPWWRHAWRPRFLVPVSGLAVAITTVALVFLQDPPITHPVPPPPQVAARPTTPAPRDQRPPSQAKPTEAVRPRRPAKVPPMGPDTTAARGTENLPPALQRDVQPADARETPAPPPADPASAPSAGRDGGIVAKLGPRPAGRLTRASDVILSLPSGHRYPANATVSVRVVLLRPARLQAMVRGPDGLTRAVYPPSAPGPLLAPGRHAFSFRAGSGTMPVESGVWKLRVLILEEDGARPQSPQRWPTKTLFVDTDFVVDPPK